MLVGACSTSTGLRDVFVEVVAGALASMEPDMDEIDSLSRDVDSVGMHVFSSSRPDTWLRPPTTPGSASSSADVAAAAWWEQGGGGEVTLDVRNFAPRFGIPEESATGTSNCALSCLVAKHLLACAPAAQQRMDVRVTCHQGQWMAPPTAKATTATAAASATPTLEKQHHTANSVIQSLVSVQRTSGAAAGSVQVMGLPQVGGHAAFVKQAHYKSS